jgi:hypothetical protein
MLIVPLPLALIVKFSFVPEDIAEMAMPLPATAACMFRPVVDPTPAETFKAGFVVPPLVPTERALTEFDPIATGPMTVNAPIEDCPEMQRVLVPSVHPLSANDVAVATPNTGVISAGELLNTAKPVPVSSDNTPANCAEVVAAN